MKKSTSIGAAIAALTAILLIPTQAMAEGKVECYKFETAASAIIPTCTTSNLTSYRYQKLSLAVYSALLRVVDGDDVFTGHPGTWNLRRTTLFGSKHVDSGLFINIYSKTLPISETTQTYYLRVIGTATQQYHHRKVVMGELHTSIDTRKTAPTTPVCNVQTATCSGLF